MRSHKQLQNFTISSLIIGLSFSSLKPVTANPAVIAPIAICAGTAGVGCVIIGTTIIGGAIYYIWKTSDGREIRANRSGQVYTGTEEPDKKKIPIPLNAVSWGAAKRECYWNLKTTNFKVYQKKGKWYCLAL